MSTPVRQLRAWSAGSVAGLSVGVGHVAGGGSPAWWLLGVLTLAAVRGAWVLADRERGLGPLVAFVLTVQLAGHLALGAVCAPVPGQAPMAMGGGVDLRMVAAHAAGGVLLGAWLRRGERVVHLLAALVRRVLPDLPPFRGPVLARRGVSGAHISWTPVSRRVPADPRGPPRRTTLSYPLVLSPTTC